MKLRLTLKRLNLPVDAAMAVLSLPSAAVAGAITRVDWRRWPLTDRVWRRFGVLPVRYHYYQPVIAGNQLAPSTWRAKSVLTGVDLRPDRQLAMLRELAPWALELADVPMEPPLPANHGGVPAFHFNNEFFQSGDAEALYTILRQTKPSRLVEVGSGFSTLLAWAALEHNRSEGFPCRHTCVEPFETEWLDALQPIDVYRVPVEQVDASVFLALSDGDVLFIDSSHVVRTGGDVNHLYLEVLPRLSAGVLIHSHDVFLPSEYPREWIERQKLFWTEQYVLHALLCLSPAFEVVLALTFLSDNHREALAKAFPVFGSQRGRRPGSFWFRKVGAT